MAIIYGSKMLETLNRLRLERFFQKVATSVKRISPEQLPPTQAAAKFHHLKSLLSHPSLERQ